MKHDLLQQLYAYVPYDEHELHCKQQVIDFIKLHDDCFERSCKPGHITASAWLTNADNSKVLLMHHAKLDMWVQPGGHCDGDSNVLNVAIKEAQEESGIQLISAVNDSIFDIDVHLVPARKQEPEHYHYDIRFLLCAENEMIVQNHEAKKLLWFGKQKEDLPTNDSSIIRMFNKWTKAYK